MFHHTCIFMYCVVIMYAVGRQISILFIDNKDFVSCIHADGTNKFRATLLHCLNKRDCSTKFLPSCIKLVACW